VTRHEEIYQPFPGFEPKRRDGDPRGQIVGAQYWLSNHGRVLRGLDANLEYDKRVKPFNRGKSTYVRLGGGNQTKSLPAAVALAFAEVQPPQDEQTWVAIIRPGTAFDAEYPDEILSCAVYDLVWTPYSQASIWSRRDAIPTDTIAIV